MGNNCLICQAISDELVLDKTFSFDDDTNVEGWIEIEYNGLFPCNLGDGPSLWSNSNSDSLRHNSSLSFSFFFSLQHYERTQIFLIACNKNMF